MNNKKIITFALGPLLSGILSVFSLPLMAWAFSKEDIGRVALLSVFLNLSFLALALGLDQSFLRFYNEIEDKKKLLCNALFPGIILFSITALLLSNSSILSKWIFDLENIAYTNLILLCVFCHLLSRISSSILRMNEEAVLFSITQSIQKIILIIGLIILVNKYNSGSIDFYFLIYLVSVSWLVLLLVHLFLNRRLFICVLKKSINLIDFPLLSKLFKYSFPLALNGLLFWGLTALDKISLKYLSSLSDVGLYSIATSLAFAGFILKSMFSSIWVPLVYKWHAQNVDVKDNINEMATYITLFTVLVFSCVGMLSWTIDFFLPTGYENIKLFLAACLGYPLLYMLSEITSIGINLTKRTVLSFIPTCIALAMNLLGNFFLIPIYGAAGAAVSTLISFFFFFFIRTEISCFVWEKIERIKIYVLLLLCILITTLTAFKVINIIFSILIWLIIFIIISIVHKNSFIKLFHRLKSRE